MSFCKIKQKKLTYDPRNVVDVLGAVIHVIPMIPSLSCISFLMFIQPFPLGHVTDIVCLKKIVSKNVYIYIKEKRIPTAKNMLFDMFRVNPYYYPDFSMLGGLVVCWNGQSVGGRGKTKRGGTA